MTPHEAQPLEPQTVASVYVWPGADEEPLKVPEPVAFDAAIRLVADQLQTRELNILSPEDATGETGHQLALLLLDNTSIAYESIQAELGYKTENKLEAAISRAQAAADQDPRMSNLFDIVQLKYKRQLAKALAEQEESERQRVAQLPWLSPEMRSLFGRARDEDNEALALLELHYEPMIEELIDEAGDQAPPEIIDAAWQAFDNQVRGADINSPQNFDKLLRGAVAHAIDKIIEDQRIQEATKELDLRQYLRDLQEFDEAQGRRQIKTALNAELLNAKIEQATELLGSRFAKNTDRPIQGYFRIPAERRPIVRRDIVRAFRQDMARKLKLSSLMTEQGLEKFHISQLPEDLLNKVVNMVADNVAQTVIKRGSQHYRNRK